MLSRRRVAIALGLGLGVGLVLCLGFGLLLPGTRPRAPAHAVSSPAPSARPADSVAVAALREWDRRRARAWADGDPAALRALYVTGSSAGSADVRLLRRWASHGVRVQGLTEQVLSARVLELRPRRIRLVVTERLAAGSAGRPGTTGVRLPRGTTSTRDVVLRRTTGEWQVVSVRQPAPRLPPT
ncbi:MAG: hypothetical protein JWO46_1445 [Nocardioidaceae bacterium]|nr:hypothetical protein [Nocardioidaceae bacterium]